MYLQSLELFGFKSFVSKTRLEFHRGVTAIVGPNGCGKSNVLDAVRWVLGEQSAKALRGGEMADVIFSGTDSRAAVGMAEVSMTFSECEEQLGLDWHEVTITRRVYRDGGSEYFLNKTPCRLRDIHQLFMDTGIGRSAYSIMEQGKIDMILSSRPEDRRAIFEEAAGITKYKAQKKEALRKLEATEANLLRLADIIKEVKRQIGSLQRQAGKARRYQALLADLKILETHLARRQYDELEARRAEAAQELLDFAEKQSGCENEIEREEAELAEQRLALDAMEERLGSARQQVNEFRSRISNHENRIAFNEERTREFRTLIDRYRTDIAAAEEKLRIAETQLRDTDEELSQITSALAGELRLLEEKQVAMAALNEKRQEAERAIGAATADGSKLESRIGSLRGQIASVLHQRESAEARLSILSHELNQLEFGFSEVSQRHGTARQDLERALETLSTASARVIESETQLREDQTTLGEIEEQLRRAQRNLSERESKREVLRQLNEGGAGFSEGTQAILRGLDNPDFFKPAVAGALAQFIDVAAEHVAAVEAVLGTNLQTIVMKETMIAESVIQTLVAQKLGKASLFLRELQAALDQAPAERAPQPPLPEGAIDWLENKVRVAPELQPLLHRLLQNTLLVADLAEALRLFPQCQSTLVTLRGEVLTHDGILHGGATGDTSSSVLERKTWIAALDEEIAGCRVELDRITEERQTRLGGIEAARGALNDAQEEKHAAALAVSTARGEVSLLERELRETERKQQTLSGERAGSEARKEEAAALLGNLERQLTDAEQALEARVAERAKLQSSLEELQREEGHASSALNELRIRVATERQRHTSLHHQRQPMAARLTELHELISQRRRDIASYEERLEAAAAESAEIATHLVTLNENVGAATQQVEELVAERAEIAVAAEQRENTLRALRHQLSQAHDERSRTEVRQAQLEMKSNALTEHIEKRYHLDLREFQRDLHALRVTVRDQLKRAERAAAANASPTSGEGGEGERAEDQATAAEKSADAGPSDSPAGEAFDLDWKKIETLVRDLDQRVDAMGPVNIDAIDEYDELEQRYTFLENQNRDLNASRDELTDVIRKINATTKTLFADTFEKIRANFSEMFVELFGGGKANLLLVDENDPLESGIDIVARPPGKQLQAISLLSGGERTMTAVALLFSIYMVKPSPFCILDEMDAPLDESNINRFIKILDRFVAQSQFVVISHNKRTIARADALYGVTMEEHGISKLVGVRFTRREESEVGRDIIGTNNPAPVPSVAEAFGKSGDLHSDQVAAG
jgi:chromosome segregation protein